MVNFRELATECRELARKSTEKAKTVPMNLELKWFLYGKARAYLLLTRFLEANLLIFPLDPEDEESTELEPEEVLKDAEGGKV